MSKLTLDALKERSEAVASTDLLNSISGGTEGDCHVTAQDVIDAIAKAIFGQGGTGQN